MKKLLILPLIILCFYGCRSTSSNTSAFPTPNATVAGDGITGAISESTYTELTKSLDPLGLIWDFICNGNALTGNFLYVTYDEVKRDSNDNFIESFYHNVTLNVSNDSIEYIHAFAEGNYSRPNITDQDTIKFYTKEKNITYSHSGNNKRFFGNPNKLTKETFTEFCQRYKDTYYSEVESNYKKIEQNVYSKGTLYVRYGYRATIEKTSIPMTYENMELEGINNKVGESIKVEIITNNDLKGLSNKTVEKDSTGTSTKTIYSYTIEK